MEHIENALSAENLGEWAGAEIGSGEVNFGFVVEDFDLAETAVYKVVKGTRFEGIREIVRSEFSEQDLADTVFDGKPLGFLGFLNLLLFKRLPKRFRDN